MPCDVSVDVIAVFFSLLRLVPEEKAARCQNHHSTNSVFSFLNFDLTIQTTSKIYAVCESIIPSLYWKEEGFQAFDNSRLKLGDLKDINCLLFAYNKTF